MKLVSIIIPCHNYGWLLSETLDSVLAQTHQHWECIVVDDGSTDATRAVMETYLARDPRFRYIYRDAGGVSAARNTGLAAAQGEYMQLLDADDLLATRKLELQVDFLERHPDFDITYGDVRFFAHGNREVESRSYDMLDRSWTVGFTDGGNQVIEKLMEQNIMVVDAPLARLSLIRKVGQFAESLRSMEDWDLWIRCAIAGARFYYDGQADTLCFVRVHPTSLTNNSDRMRHYEMLMRKRSESLLKSQHLTRASGINQEKIKLYLEAEAVGAMKQKQIWKGVKSFFKLSRHTGKYIYYGKSFVYHFIHTASLSN
ncbi:glycosyltransferase family 2 protein [Hymenobacter sp. BT491]|uniref:glycosyltransferase family 2 protein n=1 Tax=Hymenobacter sp. BT491 TaxID=2766779 RepID=UPI001653D4E1|nr:glycosyltransferase [Hymenobacter sp. BT491]MBC6988291.1 glycosyltransferase [Hymenobacter sp. BT491]